MKEKRKQLLLKEAPTTTHKAYSNLKKWTKDKGLLLKNTAPQALEIGIKKITKEEK